MQKTRYKDRNGERICIGDFLHVEEYPDKYVGGSLDFEGVVEERDGIIVVTYYDIGEEESFPVAMFPVAGRIRLTDSLFPSNRKSK